MDRDLDRADPSAAAPPVVGSGPSDRIARAVVLGSLAICMSLRSLPSLAENSAGGASVPVSGAGAKGRLRGEVSFSRQESVVGATIILIREGDPGTLFLGTTDKNGYFRFEGMPEGVWTVGVVREGAVPALKEGVPVKPPARAVVDLQLKKDEGRLAPPVLDLARFEGSGPAPGSTDAGRLLVRAFDSEMKPIREARVLIKSRGPRIDPLRGLTDASGELRLPAPKPGEYMVKVEMPGFLPARADRLVLGRTPLTLTVVLTARPLDYPARPGDLVPDEKPVPPEGFPGSPETKPGS